MSFSILMRVCVDMSNTSVYLSCIMSIIVRDIHTAITIQMVQKKFKPKSYHYKYKGEDDGSQLVDFSKIKRVKKFHTKLVNF